MSFNRGEYWIIATACIHRRIAVLDISPLDIATHSEHVFFWVVFFWITDFGFSKWFIWLATQNKTNKKSNNKRLNWSKWGKKTTSWSTNKCNPVNLSKLSLIEKEEGGGRREEEGEEDTARHAREVTSFGLWLLHHLAKPRPWKFYLPNQTGPFWWFSQ